MARNVPDAWTARSSEIDALANRLACGDIHGFGNREILHRQRLGLICSVQCPGRVIIKAFDAIRELRDAGIVVAGGFHSPMEQDCLDFLLRGVQPVIVCPARGIGRMRLPAPWRKAVDSGRMLILSPFENIVTRTAKHHAQARNEFVATLSNALLVPHASPGGKAEALAMKVLEWKKPLYTLNEDSPNLFSLGASLYDLEEIKRCLM
jgi:predicted Rossmann fold nucleotide-binding protein DprA/Smf involved in DNA uptake